MIMKITLGKKLTNATDKQNCSERKSRKSRSFQQELKDVRTQDTRVYAEDSKMRVMELYDRPNFFKTEEDDYIDIDNKLIFDGKKYQTGANSFKTRFFKEIPAGKVVEIEEGRCKIEIFSRKSNKIILSKYIGFMDLYINNNKLLFKDMNNNIVFEFEIME